MDANRQTPATGHYLHVNGMDMYYEEFGAGHPLILLHGGTSTCQTWQSLLPIFTPYFRVITPDSRAHGRSNNPAGMLSYRLMADDVAAFIHALNLEQPFVLGYSDGGQVALELGMHYHSLPGALVIGAAWYKFSPTYLNTMQAAGFDSLGEVDFERIQRQSPDWVEEMKHEHISTTAPDYWKTLLKQISVLWWTPLDYTPDDFQHITAPSLILLGDRDGIIELDQALDEYRQIPDAELFIIPGADHFTADSELSMRIVLDFFIRRSLPPAP